MATFIKTSLPFSNSPRPYANNTNDSYIYTRPGNPAVIEVSFGLVELERGYDYIYITDGNNNPIDLTLIGGNASGRITGTDLSGLSVNIPGDTVKIRLTSDGSEVLRGFTVNFVNARSGTNTAPPEAFFVSQTGTEATFSFTPPPNIQNLVSYQIQNSRNGFEWDESSPHQTPKTLFFLEPGLNFYRARAFVTDAQGVNAFTRYSAVKSFTLIDNGPLLPPQNVRLGVETLTSQQILFDAVSGATGYIYQVSNDPAFPNYAPGQFNVTGDPFFVVSDIGGFNPRVLYYVRVATNRSGTPSAYTPTFSFLSPDVAGPLLPPQNFIVQSQTETVTTIAFDPVPSATGYGYQVSLTADFSTNQNVSNVNDAFFSLLGISVYTPRIFFYVRAKSFRSGTVLQESVYSDVFAFLSPPYPLPFLTLIGITDTPGEPGFANIELECDDWTNRGGVGYNHSIQVGQTIGNGNGSLGRRIVWRVPRPSISGYQVRVQLQIDPLIETDISEVLTVVVPEAITPPAPTGIRLYADYQQEIGPPWFAEDDWALWFESLGTVKDQYLDLLVTALQARLVRFADEAGLAYLGQERNLERYPAEPTASYRNRLLTAYSFWQRAGTLVGIRRALREAGYESAIALHHFEDLSRWSEFSVTVYPLNSIPTVWDAFNWDESTWDSSSSAVPVTYLRQLILKVKSAQSKLIDVLYVPGATVTWDNFNWDSANWSDDAFPV